jgi:hypothetical protein
MQVKARSVQDLIEEIRALPRDDQEYVEYALSRILDRPSALSGRIKEAERHYRESRCRPGTVDDLWSDIYD